MTDALYAAVGQRWLVELLLEADPNRVQRGRRYADRRSVIDLAVEAGEIYGSVAGSRRDPYRVTIAARALEPEDLLDVPVPYLAELLTPRPDPVVVAKLLDLAPHIMPEHWEFDVSCTCPDWDELCKHVVALGVEFAGDIARELDPLFWFRGLDRMTLLQAMMLRTQADEARRNEAGRRGGRGRRDETSGPDVEAPRSDDRTRTGTRAEHFHEHRARLRGYEVDVRTYWDGGDIPKASDFHILHGADQAPEFVLDPPLPWPRRGDVPSYLETISIAYDRMRAAGRNRNATPV